MPPAPSAIPDSETERLIGRLYTEGQGFLRERYCQLRKSGRPEEREQLQYKVLARAEVIRQASQYGFSRWCSARAELDMDDAQRLLEHLVEQGLWDEAREQLAIARAPDQYFWSLVHELESVRTTRQKLRHAAPGVYQLWRPAVVWPGRYVLGMLIIYYNAQSGAMRTLEIHRLRAEAGAADGLVRTPGITECLRGYLVKKSSQLLIHSFQQDTHHFQITVLANLLQQEGRLRAMSGLCLGLIGQRGLFCRPVALVRQAELSEALQAALESGLDSNGWPGEHFFPVLEDDPLYRSLDVVAGSAVPDFVRQQLAESAGLTEFQQPVF